MYPPKRLTHLTVKLVLALAFVCSLFPNFASAQPAEISIRRGSGVISGDCINGLDGIAIWNSGVELIISAKSTELQSGATLGFVIYSPDNSTVNDTVISAEMGIKWGGFDYWSLSGGALVEHFGSGLPDTLLTGGVGIFPLGFQSENFIDILTIRLDLRETGIICIDSAFVSPSGAWLMTPDGPPIWSGGNGDLSVGGISSTAFCVTVSLGPGEPPCLLSSTIFSHYDVRVGDTLVLLDSSVSLRADYSVIASGAGIANVDSAGYTTYIPATFETDSVIAFDLTYSLPTFSDLCFMPSLQFCTNSSTLTVLPLEACCDTPGDADHSGSMNIGDVTFSIARIFTGGPAPICINETDTDGSGSFNIADVTLLIARIFSGGPAPVCGSAIN